jgi:hypothetical protein
MTLTKCKMDIVFNWLFKRKLIKCTAAKVAAKAIIKISQIRIVKVVPVSFIVLNNKKTINKKFFLYKKIKTL